MKIERCSKAVASRDRVPIAFLAAWMTIAGLAGCTSLPWTSPTTPAATPESQAAARPAYPFEEAVTRAADALLAAAPAPSAGEPRTLVIDPLIDEATAFRSAATESMQARIVQLARDKYPRFAVRDLTEESVAEKPLVLLGSLAGSTGAAGVGTPDAYRIWLVLADLRTGRIVARGTSLAVPGGIDLTPVNFDRDRPAWTPDAYVKGYLATCGGEAGDPIDPVYLEGIEAAALVREATDAYDAGRYEEALDLYTQASRTAAGDQSRVHNGLYLANYRLGRTDQAAAAFGDLVDHGLRNDRLAIRFLFKPATATFWPPELARPYPIWLEQLARRAADSATCLEVTGHTSPTGPAALNERLSLRRAEYVAERLREDAPGLANRMIANGVGSRENIVGTGTDDATDALDRRVEFRALPCGRQADAAAAPRVGG